MSTTPVADPTADLVVFDLDSMGALRRSVTAAPPSARLTGYPHTAGVVDDLAGSGRRLGLWWHDPDLPAGAVVGLVDDAGLTPDRLGRSGWWTAPGPAVPPPPTGAGARLLVSEDNEVRASALDQGWRVAPHPVLAAAVLDGDGTWFVRITAPAGVADAGWSSVVGGFPLVPLRVSGPGGRELTAITADRALGPLADAHLDVQILGQRDDPLRCDLYLLRDDGRASPGSLTPSGQYDQLFGPAQPANQALVLATSGEGVLIRLPTGRGVDDLHFATAAHGHNLKLLADPGLLDPAPVPSPPALGAPGALAADRDPTPAEVGALARITPTSYQSVLDRYAGVTPLGDATGTRVVSRHILHADNPRSVAQLVTDLTAIGGSALRVAVHAFTHNGRTHHNVEAELAGTDPALVLVTAHLDSTAASSPPYAPAGDPAPGADDDASGVAAVLAAAEVLVALAAAERPKRTIRFVLFNAEEHGLIGSQAYARDARAAGADIVAVYQMDMIGYNVAAPRTCEVHAGYQASAPVQDASVVVAERLRRLAKQVAPALDEMQLYLSSPGSPDPAEGRSDHAPFQTRGYPACVATEDFFAGPGPSSPPETNPNYHRRGDTVVDAAYAADIARSVAAAAWITAQPTTSTEGDNTMSIRIATGSTTPGSTNWQPYGGNTGVYVDVDTTSGRFSTTPSYITSLGGTSSHWATTGATSIYDAKPTGFRVYLRWSNGSSLTPAQANSFQWHVNWVGVES